MSFKLTLGCWWPSYYIEAEFKTHYYEVFDYLPFFPVPIYCVHYLE